MEDKDELTFGSRPPTAPQKKKPNFDESASDFADSSLVMMGQITADRKNNLIGNAFQLATKNTEYDPENPPSKLHQVADRKRKTPTPEIIKSDSYSEEEFEQ